MEENKHGGARKGAGRKRKADEEKVRRLGEAAIVTVYGSLDAYYEFIAKQSKKSLGHLKLLQEYVFGKPKEVVVLEDDLEDDWDLSDLTDKELETVLKINARQKSNTTNE